VVGSVEAGRIDAVVRREGYLEQIAVAYRPYAQTGRQTDNHARR